METRFSTPVQTGPEAHPASCKMGTGSSPGVKDSRDVTLTPHPLLVRGQEKVELYHYSPMGRTACTELQCLYRGHFTFTFFMFGMFTKLF